MKNKKNLTAFLFIFLSSVFISIPLFNFNVQYDDGIQHIVRLIETLRTLKGGSIFPVIMQNLCNGFGYSWNLFYSPLTAFLPLVFRIFGFSFSNCIRIFMFFISIASGYSMYFFMEKILQEKDIDDNRKNLISVLSASLYIMAPYRLTDSYIRVAVAELASFVFIPIIFNGLYTIVNQNKKSYILAFGTIGLLLTHTLISLYTAIFCAFYLLINIKKIKFNELKSLFFNLLVALLVTAFYWVPLLESRFATNYEVFNTDYMVRENVLTNLKVEPQELLIMKDNRMAYFIGLPVIAGIILTFSTYKKIDDKKNYILFLVFGLISTILTLNFIPFEKFPNILKMMQFSFRLLEFSSFFLIVIASLNLGFCFKKFTLFPTIVIVCLMADLLIPITKNIDFSNKYIDENDLIKGIPVTENTGRVHAGCASFEYLPNKAFENRDYIVTREDVPIVLDGVVQITNFVKNKTNCSFEAVGTGTIELPYIFYIGYQALVDGEKVDITESENGFCQIKINQNNIESANYQNAENVAATDIQQVNTNKPLSVSISYTGSMLMKISLLVSIISLIIFFVIIFYNKKLTYSQK